jgi:hypothetical protein
VDVDTVVTEVRTIASAIILQLVALVPKPTVRPDCAEVTISPSAAAPSAWPDTSWVISVNGLAYVCVVLPLSPVSPKIMSYTPEVDMDPLVGSPLAPSASFGTLVLVSNDPVLGELAPDIPNATAVSLFESVPENVTVIVILPPAVKSAHHSEIY